METKSELRPSVTGLTQGQIDCLVLVAQNLTSKEIAPLLGISPHTVDQRIRRAMQSLNVARRVDAARIVSSRSTPGIFIWPDHQDERLIHSVTLQSERNPPLPLPFATKHRPTNTLTVAQRLLWIILIAMGAALSTGMYLAGLESLARMLRESS
jgi:DNA-binding CsgD family transcriptional regulator